MENLLSHIRRIIKCPIKVNACIQVKSVISYSWDLHRWPQWPCCTHLSWNLEPWIYLSRCSADGNIGMISKNISLQKANILSIALSLVMRITPIMAWLCSVSRSLLKCFNSEISNALKETHYDYECCRTDYFLKFLVHNIAYSNHY